MLPVLTDTPQLHLIPSEPEDDCIDHVFLRHMLDWLESATSKGSLAELLDKMSQYLSIHFAREEEDGELLDAILAVAPRYERAVRELRADHLRMLVELRVLRDAFADSAGPIEDVQRVALQHWIAALRDHEQLEEELLQKSLGIDLGLGSPG